MPFVAGVAWLGGWRWAFPAALIGLVGGWSALLPARASLAPADACELYALRSYALGSAAVIALLELARRTRRGLVERRAGEGWLALASEAAGVGTFEWDLKRDRIVWSPELARIYGVAPGTFDGRYES